MAGFRGLYDKLVSFILDTSKVSGTYDPVSTDYVAVYDSTGPRNLSEDATWMPKKYVPVTDIGTGGGGGGGLETVTFNGVGDIKFSLDGEPGSYETTQTVDVDNSTIYIDFTSVPNGLTWQGAFSNLTNYDTNDVVSWVDSATSIYYTYWATTSIASGGGNPNVNEDWVLLGSQGPQGIEGPPNAIATAAFRTATTSTNVLATGSNVGTNNDRGVFILMDSSASTTLTILSGLSTNSSTGIPLNSQVSVMKMGTGNVQVVAASGVTLLSADNATYLRTQYSSATLIRKGLNEWYLFGDLTNIS